MSTLRFEWDERTAAANAKKHGVGFDEANCWSEGNLIRTVSARKAPAKECKSYP